MLQEKLMSFALMGGEWVLWLLVLLSILCLTVAVERLIYSFLNSTPRYKLQEAITAFLQGGDTSEFKKHVSEMKGMEARVLHAGVESGQQDGPAAAEDAIAGHIKLEKLKLDRGLVIIGTTGSNAPFVGLFGTVLGIIKAFNDLASNTAEAADAVMAGISEALVATAVGLMVAIPAVILYNAFQRRNKARLGELESMSLLILSRFKSPNFKPSVGEQVD